MPADLCAAISSCYASAGTLITPEKVAEHRSVPQTLSAAGCGIRRQGHLMRQP